MTLTPRTRRAWALVAFGVVAFFTVVGIIDVMSPDDPVERPDSLLVANRASDDSLLVANRASDDSLLVANRRTEEAQLLAKVRTVPASAIYENRNLYAALLRRNPADTFYQRKHAYYDARVKADQRRQYARELEDGLLGNRLDVEVSTTGQAATTLRLKWALASRVTVHYLRNETTLDAQAAALGFSRIVLFDGFGFEWSWEP